MIRDLIIIGSGPAGYTAAIYAARNGIDTLMFEGDQVGGQLTTTTEVENFPGFPEGIQGPDLMVAMREQTARFDCEIVSSKVTEVDFSSQPLKVTAGDRVEEAKAVIIATGASAKRLGLESETALYGKGVSACATCDGYFFRGKRIAVVGGGDSAMEEANFLTKFADEVTVLVRKDELKASQIMEDKAKNNPKVKFMWSKEVTEVLGVEEGKVTGVRLRDTKTGEEIEFECEGLFVAIGHNPNTDIFKDQVAIERGYITADETKTSVPGVFACGDVQDFRYRQAITAAGSGCKAALEAQWFLEEQGE